MDSDSKQKIYTVMMMVNIKFFCHLCDKLAIDRYYNNHLKSQAHINSFRKRQQLNVTNNSTSSL